MPDLTPDEFRRLGHEVIDWIADYRESIEQRPVRADVAPGDVRAALPDTLPEHGDGLPALLRDLSDLVLPGTTHWQHPGFFGYFPANASLASVLGDVLSTGIGVQGMLWSTGPAATELEQHLTDLLVPALGLPEAFATTGGGGGMITEASSSANLVALLAALHRGALHWSSRDNPDAPAAGGWQTDGVDHREVVYVSEHTHSSMERAVRIAGLGSAAVRVVASDPWTHAMRADALEEAVEDDRAAGKRPVMVCATVGTTSTGAVDPVRAAGELCAKHDIWLHVDAAWAGAATVCPEHRDLLDGLEHADSYCTDAHKWLLTAFDCTLLWTRRPAVLADALAVTPEYLRNAASESGQVTDYRNWQIPLGRRFRALKLWAVLRQYGLEGLREHVRGHVELASWLAAEAAASPLFELAAPPQLALVCVRVTPPGRHPGADGGEHGGADGEAAAGAGTDGGADGEAAARARAEAADAATREVLRRVNDTGRAFLTHTVVGGRHVIRVAIGGVATERRHVEALWHDLEAAAADVVAGR